MNRRVLLTTYPLYLNQAYNRKLYKTVPVDTQKINNTDTFFVSRNKKLVINTFYEDNEDSVFVINNIQWQDPITNKIMKQTRRDVYILDMKEV